MCDRIIWVPLEYICLAQTLKNKFHNPLIMNSHDLSISSSLSIGLKPAESYQKFMNDTMKKTRKFLWNKKSSKDGRSEKNSSVFKLGDSNVKYDNGVKYIDVIINTSPSPQPYIHERDWIMNTSFKRKAKISQTNIESDLKP